MRALAVAATVLFSAAGATAPLDPAQGLYLPEGVLHPPPRAFGFAGAYVGVAEAADGVLINPASVVARDLRDSGDTRFDVMLNIYLLPPFAVATTDWDNDGVVEEPKGSERALENHGAQLLYASLNWQHRNVGVALTADVQNYTAAVSGGDFAVALLRDALTVGVALWRRQLHVGIALETEHALFTFYTGHRLAQMTSYSGLGGQVGAVLRPSDARFRLGASLRMPQVDPRSGAGTLGGYTLFSAGQVPGRLSVGGSVVLGKTWRPYNLEDPAQLPETVRSDGVTASETALGGWLLSGQVDLIFPVAGAASLSAFFGQRWGLDALPAGARWGVSPRLGVEKDLIDRRLRFRGGAYLEPPLTDAARYRPHAVAMLDLYLFQRSKDLIGFQLGVDWAPQFLNLSIGLLAPWK